jgi:quercetin dioxygenase-like cupin family protein
MKSWNLHEVETPEGSRSPVVLHSQEARVVVIGLDPGQKLGEHEVKEQAIVTIIEGNVRVEAGGESQEAGPGSLFVFDPEERHAISSEAGARVLLVLAPWPGEGHFRGHDHAADAPA